MDSSLIDMSGRVFGSWTVIERAPNRNGKTFWRCQCVCGAKKEVRAAKLRSGHTRSCGCVKARFRHTHGKSRTPEYKIWRGMIQRCRDLKDPHYGGRGIRVVFKSFQEFFAEVGKRPSADHSIDRWPNFDGDYAPGNVRWATWSQQNANQRRRTYCPRGHPLSGNNARVRSRNGSTQRECRICRRLFRNMGEAAQRFSHKPLVLLNGVPPLVPWNSVPKTWPANEKTAAILAQKVLAKQARGRETPSDLRHSPAAP